MLNNTHYSGNESTVPATATDGGAPPAGDTPTIGARMGRYVLRSLLGSGGMGVVFAAHDPELDRAVAVKVLHVSTVESEARMRREAQTMARLTHPNVIRVYDAGVARDRSFVAMEYVEGGTLLDWLTVAPRGADEIVSVFAQAGRGLAAAHRAGLVHRDFKPSNVLVGDDGRVLVTDFGLARSSEAHDDAEGSEDPAPITSLLGTVTRAGGRVGTPAYMAPEQHAGATVDARADQFSFCVALWSALYGVAPFQGETPRELAASTARGVPVRPPPEALARVPARVRAALARGLRPAPAERFPSLDELLAALEPARATSRGWWGIALPAAVVALGLLLAHALTRDAPEARREPSDAMMDLRSSTSCAPAAAPPDQRRAHARMPP